MTYLTLKQALKYAVEKKYIPCSPMDSIRKPKDEKPEMKVLTVENVNQLLTEAKKTEKVVRSVTGRVVSDKMDKTVTVLVERSVKHPLYGKVMRRSNKFHAHDEKNECNEGDLVVIEEGRPLSRTKTWRVTKIVEKAQVV